MALASVACLTSAEWFIKGSGMSLIISNIRSQGTFVTGLLFFSGFLFWYQIFCLVFFAFTLQGLEQ